MILFDVLGAWFLKIHYFDRPTYQTYSIIRTSELQPMTFAHVAISVYALAYVGWLCGYCGLISALVRTLYSTRRLQSAFMKLKLNE